MRKLDDLNFDTFHWKVQYLFYEQEVLETLTNSL